MMILMSPLCLIQLIVVLIVCIPLNDAQESGYTIVGGVNVAPGEIPYQVSLQYNGKHNCGGSILNNCWILTAAHCVDGFSVSAMTVLAGTTKLNSGGVRVAVERGIAHEEFKRPHTPNDIAVVKLKQCLTYSKDIQPVKLSPQFVDYGVIGIVSGWGFTDQNKKIPTNDLKKVEVTTITNRGCSKTFRNVISGNICTISPAGRGGCQGDSGGPLVGRKTKALIGLVSANIPCALGKPDLFTRISAYMGWIEKHIN